MTTTLHFKKLPSDIPYGAEVSINTSDVVPVSHGFHKYPGKFIPQIPEWAIKTYLQHDNEIILDPFVGSGTTLVESLMTGYKSYGIDIDPLSCLISKVKSTPILESDFSLVCDWILLNIDSTEPEFMPQTERLTHWFTEEAIEKLSRIRSLTEKVPDYFSHIENISDIYDALIIAFSGIIRRVSNADNQSQKTYVSHTREKKPAEVFSLYTKQLQVFKRAYIEFERIWDGDTRTSLILSDGRADISSYMPEKVNLIITSPPYIKSIDYVYNQMVELFWVGDLFNMDTQPKQNKKRKKYTGTTLVNKSEYADFSIKDSVLDSALLTVYLTEVLKDEKNGQKHAHIVNDYFEYMYEHFVGAFKIIENNGHYVMAIGNSTVSGIKIDTASLLIEFAEKAGFQLETKWSYLIKNHFMGFDRGKKGGKITKDHMLIFKKL